MKNKKQTIYRIILAVALLLIVSGCVWLGSDYLKRVAAQKEYESLAQMAKETSEAPVEIQNETESATEEETTVPYSSPIDFEALKEINPHTIAWITIPDTKVDYPIVYTDNNDTYLTTDFEGKKSVSGTVYLDFESEPDFSGKHNIIYGHNMKNGSMFKDVIKFKDQEFFREHRDIYIYTPDREIHLRTIAALYTDAAPMKRKTKFSTDESFRSYVEEMTTGCKFRELPTKPITSLFSFVTCSYEFDNARTILYAYEVQE